MRVSSAMLLLGTLVLAGCDAPQKSTDATAAAQPPAKTKVADRYTGTGSRIPQRSGDEQQAQPDVQTTGQQGYADAVRGAVAGMGGTFSH